MRLGSKINNASYNSRLTDNNTSSLRGSLRSIASSPLTNGSDTGPLRLHYRTGSSIRFKSTVHSDEMTELDDNFMYMYHRGDQNMNRFVSIYCQVQVFLFDNFWWVRLITDRVKNLVGNTTLC